MSTTAFTLLMFPVGVGLGALLYGVWILAWCVVDDRRHGKDEQRLRDANPILVLSRDQRDSAAWN